MIEWGNDRINVTENQNIYSFYHSKRAVNRFKIIEAQ